jgi:hypothetical protein
MATQLTFRRGTSEPTQASGLTLGEPAFNTTLNTLHIGRGAGITATWVGAQISGLSTGIAAGLTYQVPTMSAVKDYVASTTSGVATLNSLTGAVTIAAGTNIGVTSASGSITVTNQGVQTFNGATGAVTGASLGANTFTALNTFNAGITASSIYASTGSTFGGTLKVVGGATFDGRVYVGGDLYAYGSFTSNGPATFGRAVVFEDNGSSGVTFDPSVRFTKGLTSSGDIRFTGSTPKEIFSNTAPLSIVGVTGNGAENSIILPVDNSALLLGSATGNVTIVNNQALASVPGLRILTDDFDIIGSHGTVIKPIGYATAERTQTLQNASGTIALTSQLMGTVNGSTAATTAVTSFNGLTGAVQGIQSFNGATGAATGASLGANTFIGLNTFNGGITTSFLYASTGSTFGARVDVAGILDVVGGVTLESTLNVSGAARFASTVVSTGSVTANGGLTASTFDVSGTARLASTLAVTGVLTQTGGATFASTTDHTGAARFASTLVSTGSVTANGGLTASTLDVSGAARTTGDVTVGATLTVNGNFQVYGTLTTVNRTDLNIDDKTITMGRTLASDTLADNGGLSLSGTAARTWTWSNSRSAWESNQGVNVASTYGYAVNGTSVLTSNTLGSGVTGSSLTKVGTLTTGVWQATAIGATYGGTGIISYTIGDVLYANGTSSLAKLTTTTAGYLLAANGAGAAPEYKQVLIKDAAANSIATVTSGSGTLTATIQNATSSAKGVASFDNTNFTVSTGAVTITGVDGGTY